MKHFILLMVTIIFIGCGSGETEKTQKDPKVDSSKKADGIFTAGDNQHVLEGKGVKLQTSIYDKTKEFTSFKWTENGKTISNEKEFIADNLSKGKHYITLLATDKQGNTYTDTVFVEVKADDPNNTPPTTEKISFDLDEDSYFSTYLSGGDADGDELRYVFVSQPKHGKLSGSAADLKYTPDLNYNGTDSFIYKTNDGTIDSDYSTVEIHVRAVNDIPTAIAQTITTSEDMSKEVILNGEDIEDSGLNFTVVTPPSHGDFNGSIYTPNPNYNGNDSFSFIVNDGELDSKETTVSILISAVNDSPIAVSDFHTTDKNNTLTFNVLANDTDIDLDAALSLISVNFTEANGIFTSDGNIIFSPIGYFDDLGYEQDHNVTLIYTIKDEHNATSDAHVTITVIGLNNIPIINPLMAINTYEDRNISTLYLIDYVSDENTETLNFKSDPIINGLTFSTTSYTFDPSHASYQYLNAGETKNLITSVIAKDEHGEEGNTSLSITVIGTNDAPIAHDDTIKSYGITTINVLNNDADFDTGDKSNLIINNIVITDTNGTVVISADNKSIIYTPDNNFSGTDTFSYRCFDGNITSNEANVTIRVTRAFITTWETNTSNQSITIYTNSSYGDYNYTVDWGDNNKNTSIAEDITHTYTNEGNHTVKIYGTFPSIDNHNHTDNAKKLISINQWGSQKWETMAYSFHSCENIEVNATDTPDLSQAESMTSMFWMAKNLTGDTGNWNWDVSNIKNMSGVFAYTDFDGNITDWNVSNTTTMMNLFANNDKFNQDISNWKTSSLQNTQQMFLNASNFNQDISSWDLSNATNISYMFYRASSFNQDISNWNISNVGGTYSMQHLLNNSNFSTDNYDKLLDKWSKLPLQNNVKLGAQGLNYVNIQAHDILTNDFNWTILDNGASNIPPVADIGMDDITIQEGESITFDASLSYDVDGNITYYWSVNSTTSNNKTFSHTFTSIMEHTVNLTVTDDKGAIDTDSIIITVNLASAQKLIFTKGTITKEPNTKHIKLADLDKDGDLDILAHSTTNVFWYKNRGNDNNFTKHTISNGSGINTVQVGYINSDDLLDIAIGGNSMEICYNNENGDFNCSVNINRSAEDNITSISINDINADNEADILYTNTGVSMSNISAFLQYGGNFSAGSIMDIEIGITGATAIDSKDFNGVGDGNIDIVVAYDGGVKYYENNGNGEFTSKIMSYYLNPASVFIADINKQNKLDVIVTHSDTNTIRWLSGTLIPFIGGSIINERISYNNITNLSFASGVDMDGDGDIDVLSNSNEINGTMFWYENSGSGLIPTFTLQNIATVDNVIHTQSGDIDNDGNMDIVALNIDGDIYLYKNNTETLVTQIPSPTDTNSTRFKDAGNDIIDKLTGLKWQNENMNNNKEKWIDAKNYCDGINWRLPTVYELMTITDKGANNPAIYNIFTNTQASEYWTSTSKIDDNTKAWSVDFDKGNNKQNINKDNNNSILCTQGEPLKTTLIRDDNRNLVLDKKHGLMWYDKADIFNSQEEWGDAVIHCNDFKYNGFDDWRLPNINELYSISDKNRVTPAINDAFKHTTPTEYTGGTIDFWSSTDLFASSDKFQIDFQDGSDSFKPVGTQNYVRCIRDMP